MIIRVLDWADRRGIWWPALAGFLSAFALYALLFRIPWLWLLAGPGLVMAAIRPTGTLLSRRRLIRQAREVLDRRAGYRDEERHAP